MQNLILTIFLLFLHLFTDTQRKHGALILHLLGAIYFFTLLAVVCNDYFLPSVQCICEDLNISKVCCYKYKFYFN